VGFKGVQKGRDLPNNIADLLAGATRPHMLGIDYGRQRTVLARHCRNKALGLFGA
jgi:hypothetical protein